jgi:hypothetical protein
MRVFPNGLWWFKINVKHYTDFLKCEGKSVKEACSKFKLGAKTRYFKGCWEYRARVDCLFLTGRGKNIRRADAIHSTFYANIITINVSPWSALLIVRVERMGLRGRVWCKFTKILFVLSGDLKEKRFGSHIFNFNKTLTGNLWTPFDIFHHTMNPEHTILQPTKFRWSKVKHKCYRVWKFSCNKNPI